MTASTRLLVDPIACDGRGQLDILLDYVYAVGCYEFIEQPAGGPFAWLGLADQPPAAGQAAHDSRPDGPLQVENRIVLAGSECAAQSLDFIEGLAGERRFPPLFGGSEMKAVDQGLGRVGLVGQGFIDCGKRPNCGRTPREAHLRG